MVRYGEPRTVSENSVVNGLAGPKLIDLSRGGDTEFVSTTLAQPRTVVETTRPSSYQDSFIDTYHPSSHHLDNLTNTCPSPQPHQDSLTEICHQFPPEQSYTELPHSAYQNSIAESSHLVPTRKVIQKFVTLFLMHGTPASTKIVGDYSPQLSPEYSYKDLLHYSPPGQSPPFRGILTGPPSSQYSLTQVCHSCSHQDILTTVRNPSSHQNSPTQTCQLSSLLGLSGVFFPSSYHSAATALHILAIFLTESQRS